MATVSTNIKIDENLKREAQELFSKMGLNLSIAVNMFLSQAVREQAMPFKSTLNVYPHEIPNAETLKAIKEFHEGKNVSRTFDYCEPHTRDFNHELGKQNSQRI